MTVDEEKLMGYVHQAVGDFGIHIDGRTDQHRRQAGLIQSDGGRRTVDPGRVGREDRHDRALRARAGRVVSLPRDMSTTPVMAAISSMRSRRSLWRTKRARRT